jgi:hypothetical protein
MGPLQDAQYCGPERLAASRPALDMVDPGNRIDRWPYWAQRKRGVAVTGRSDGPLPAWWPWFLASMASVSFALATLLR